MHAEPTRPTATVYARTTADHIATMAALEASDIAMRITDDDQPGTLLANIETLNGLADLARWAVDGLRGPLSDAGRAALAVIRLEDADELQKAQGDPTVHPDDVDYARRSVAMDAEAIAIAERT